MPDIYTAVRCGVLQCVAVRCSALQCVAVRYIVLHRTIERAHARQKDDKEKGKKQHGATEKEID